MIIVKLMGGLGNQMFQYAFGKHLAEKNKTALKLDLGYLNNTPSGDTVRKFSLDIFELQESIASPGEVNGFFVQKPKSFFSKLGYKLNKLVSRKTVVREKKPFDPSVLNQKGDCYLEGFWQSEKYFIDVEDIIRSAFQFKFPPHEKVISLYQEITSSDSVSIHIRRGDYVTNRAANTFHGLCSLEYFEKGIQLIAKKVSNPKFFIFSDDIAWAKENLKIQYPHTFVDYQGVPDYEDLRLMSGCKHHIIANSSFSWWGAWLNKNKNKVVVAPSRWFLGDSDQSDIIPDSWYKIGN